MTHLSGLLLRVMRSGSQGAAAFVALVLVIEVWKRWRYGGFAAMTTPDWGFLGVLVVMLVGFLWLARAMGREIAKNPGA